jgi:recombination protein RecT
VKADGKDVDKKLDQREQAKAVAKTVRSLSEDPAIQKRFNEVLGDEKIARSFMASVLSAINATPALMQCDPFTVWGSAMQAAALDLPVDKNLGFAAIVPYKGKAQFQIMRGGYIQLAQRTREYKTINCSPVFEGEIVEINPITGEIEFAKGPNKYRDAEDESKIVGYAAYFKLLNGFEKTIYWSKEKVDAHAKRYSRAYASEKETNLWRTDFHAMAMKTVLKALVVKWGPLTAFTRKAVAVDQSTTDDLENPLDNIQYADRPDDGPPDLDNIPGIAKGAKTKEDEIF